VVQTLGRGDQWITRGIALALAVVVLVAGCSGDNGPRRIPLGAGAETRAATADEGSMMAMAAFDFVLADGLDLPASEGDAWRWEAPDAAAVGDLAGRLGVEGSVMAVPTADGGGWVVEDVDSGATLNVAANGSWWGASGGDRSFVVSSDCPDGVVVPMRSTAAGQGPQVTVLDDASPCGGSDAVPPADLPPEADVLSSATVIFGESSEVRIEGRGDGYVSVVAGYLVDGQDSGQVGYFGVGPFGWDAAGLLGEAVREGPYPTISASEAVGRLVNSPLGMGLVAVPEVGEPDVLVEPGPAVEPIPDPGVVIEPEPVVEPVPSQVVLVDVRAALVPFFDATGAAWSLPGYVYTDADGGQWEVVAVSDESFDLSPEVPDDVAVVPPVDGDVPVSDVPDRGSDPRGGGAGVVGPFPGDPSAGVDDPGREVVAPDVVGLSEGEATGLLEEAGFAVRVAERDGEPFMLTRDYRGDRVNLVVSGGVVTSVWVG
jgi:hypothetical protein